MEELVGATLARLTRQVIVSVSFGSIGVALYLVSLHVRWFAQGRDRLFHAAFVLFLIGYSVNVGVLTMTLRKFTEIEPSARALAFGTGLVMMLLGLLGIADGYRRAHRFKHQKK